MSVSQYIIAKISSFDWLVISIVLLLIFIGIIAIQSATLENSSLSIQKNFQKQIIWSILGFVIFFSMSFISFRWLYAISYLILFGGVLLLISTYLPTLGGGASRRWISLGGMTFQPSEFMKVFLIVGLARLLTDNIKYLNSARGLIPPFIVTFAISIIILRQPDLGTALVFPAILFPMLYWAGIPLLTLFIIIAPLISLLSAFNLLSFVFWIGLILSLLWIARKSLRFIVIMFLLNVSVGLASPIMWSSLKPYQQQRILSYVDRQLDPRGSGYQVLQSKVAIGSGGLYGKGLGDGTQTQLKFLPEQHTDFIISLIGEELGFLGVSTILLLFMILIIRIIHIASRQINLFESFILVGTASLVIFQVFVNVGMTTGLIPVTGLPLPFISYGGSSLLSIMMLMGLVQCVSTEN